MFLWIICSTPDTQATLTSSRCKPKHVITIRCVCTVHSSSPIEPMQIFWQCGYSTDWVRDWRGVGHPDADDSVEYTVNWFWHRRHIYMLISKHYTSRMILCYNHSTMLSTSSDTLLISPFVPLQVEQHCYPVENRHIPVHIFELGLLYLPILIS
jgi:metal-sulfur cluster biosynthetic enzyme